MTNAVHTDTVDVGTATLAYDEAGEGDPVVFVHSGITDRRMWDREFAALADGFRAIRYDLQGFGESRATGDGTNREELLALLDALDVDGAHVVACSFGASIALDAALERPERVRSLALLGPTVGGHEFEEPADSPVWDRVVERFEASVAAFEAEDYREAAEHEVALWVTGPERAVDAVDADVRERVVGMDEAALRQEATGRREDATDLDPPAVERLDSLAMPLFVVVGECDLPNVHEAASILAERAPDARRSVVADAAHLSSLERPVEVERLLRGFWADVAEGTT